MTTNRLARSYLFVPADRPERFAKAHQSGADTVILDLEDAVSEGNKAHARRHLADHLDAGGTCIVRVNAIRTPWFDDDLRACQHPGVHGVVLPKTENAGEIAQLVDRLPPGVGVLPLVETALGMMNAREIASAPGVERLLFGTVDFRTELGIEGDDQELLFFRSRLVLVSRVAGIAAPVDGVTVAIPDVEALRRATDHGRRLGFGGKLCIHPTQVAIVNAAYRPSETMIAWAERVIEAARSNPGAFRLDGEMVDAPVIARAADLLKQAGRVAA